MPAPFPPPIGLRLAQTARAVERAFDEALAAAGGTLPVWLILLNLKVRKPANQRELAEAVGVREATLTHHLNAMDTRGLITRTRDTSNRRVQVVALTEAGEAAFVRLRETAMAFDAPCARAWPTTTWPRSTPCSAACRPTSAWAQPPPPGPAWPTAANSGLVRRQR